MYVCMGHEDFMEGDCGAKGRKGVGKRDYWMVYCPHSILAWGSELRFSLRMIIFALVLGSASSASDCEGYGIVIRIWYFRGNGGGYSVPVHRRLKRRA